MWLGTVVIAAAAPAASEQGENRARIEPTGFFYGGALGVRREIYADYERRIIPLPVIGYRGEKLRVFGPFVSYEVGHAGAMDLDVRLSPRFSVFDESDSDNFDGMEEREFSMDAGFGLTWARDDWKLELAGLRDALDRSNGKEWSATLGRAYRAGTLLLEPAIGLSYLDRRHVDYYYGVDTSEATGSRPVYRGDSALNTTLGLTLATPALFGGLTRIGIENTWYDSPIEDSPITDADSNLSVFIAFSKFFDK
ncbi:MAG: MipA/OmpV family protein [Gammaproteobacteria bacterium]|nr:MipA/OmpV family protein [Gammaproteobacteria bacterium]